MQEVALIRPNVSNPFRRPPAALVALVCLVAASTASTARAGDFYGSVGLAISGAKLEAGGLTALNNAIAGEEWDSSPVISGAVGFEAPLRQVFPRNYRLPRWVPFEIPEWSLRSELEIVGGRQYDFSTPGDAPLNDYRTSVKSWAMLVNVGAEMPLERAFEMAFGRVRALEPLALDLALGLGFQNRETTTTDGFLFGSADDYDFAWQISTGFVYPLSERVKLTLGYRYFGLGSAEISTDALAGGFPRQFTADLAAHELAAGLRVRFYSIRWPRGGFRSRDSLIR